MLNVYVIWTITVYLINMKKFRSFKDISNFKFNVCPSRSSLVDPSIMKEFQTRKVTFFVGDSKREATCIVDDIYMLFNQSRLINSGVGRDTLQAWLNTLTPRSDSLAQLRKKCTDEQLMQICKSRYIQSPSELLAWSDYLNANYADIVAKVQAAQLQAAQQQQASQQQQLAAQQQQASQQQQLAAQQQSAQASSAQPSSSSK